MILLPGKGWPGMALGQMRGAALTAACAVLTCERARERPRALAVLTGPSRHGQKLASLSGPAAERAVGLRLPASSRARAAAAMTVSRFTADRYCGKSSLGMPPSAGRRGC
jgi:hypothetical protein